MVAYNMNIVFLPIGGLFFQLCACWVAPAKRKSSDILLMFLWICIIILLPFKDLKLMKADLQNTWLSIEYITQYHMVRQFEAKSIALTITLRQDRIKPINFQLLF